MEAVDRALRGMLAGLLGGLSGWSCNINTEPAVRDALVQTCARGGGQGAWTVEPGELTGNGNDTERVGHHRGHAERPRAREVHLTSSAWGTEGFASKDGAAGGHHPRGESGQEPQSRSSHLPGKRMQGRDVDTGWSQAGAGLHGALGATPRGWDFLLCWVGVTPRFAARRARSPGESRAHVLFPQMNVPSA